MGLGQGDWIFLGALLVVLFLGSILGFGKVLSFFVLNKAVRIIIAVFVCYTFGGMILGISFVNQLLVDLKSSWANSSFLNAIHLEIIIYYVALFIITMILILIISRILRGVSESKFLPIRILNKVCGAVLLSAFALAIMLLVFQIIVWIGGETAVNFGIKLSEKADKILLPLYEDNPMLKLIELAKTQIN